MSIQIITEEKKQHIETKYKDKLQRKILLPSGSPSVSSTHFHALATISLSLNPSAEIYRINN